MKILFLNPNTSRFAEESNSATEARAKYLPYSLASCAAVARNAGYKISILDAAVEDLLPREWLKKIKRQKPDILIISVNAVTSDLDLEGLEDLKKKVNFKLIVLVVLPSFTKEVLNRYPKIDVGIGVEWAWALSDTVKALDKKKPLRLVKGIYYRNKGRIKKTPPRNHININKLPIPAFDLLHLKKYDGYALITSLGCRYRCAFCPFEKHLFSWEERDLDLVFQEIDTLFSLGGRKKIIFLDNEFTLDRERIVAFCKRIIKERRKIYWDCNTRANTVDRKISQLMGKAGCVTAALGVESGNQKILNLNRKALTLEQVKKAVKLLKEASILTKAYFMAGLIGETRATLKDTHEFILNETKGCQVSLGLCMPYPSTYFYEFLKERGLIKKISIDNLIWIHKHLDAWPQLQKLKGEKPGWRLEDLEFEEILDWLKKEAPFIKKRNREVLFSYTINSFWKNIGYLFWTYGWKTILVGPKKLLQGLLR